jgi:hypothetical protein
MIWVPKGRIHGGSYKTYARTPCMLLDNPLPTSSPMLEKISSISKIIETQGADVLDPRISVKLKDAARPTRIFALAYGG